VALGVCVPEPATLDVDDPDAIDALGVGEPLASAIVPPMTRPPTTSSATAVSIFRRIDVIRSSFVPLDLVVEISWSHRREGPVTGRPERGKGLGKPQSSSDPEEPEPELEDPDPELEDPDPELEDPEPELSSPGGSSEPEEEPPWSSTEGEGVPDRSPWEGLGASDDDRDGVSVGWTTCPTSSPASASAPTVRATAATSPPIPSTTTPMTFFTPLNVAVTALRLG
jgi:hypothetical protein